MVIIGSAYVHKYATGKSIMWGQFLSGKDVGYCFVFLACQWTALVQEALQSMVPKLLSDKCPPLGGGKE